MGVISNITGGIGKGLSWIAQPLDWLGLKHGGKVRKMHRSPKMHKSPAKKKPHYKKAKKAKKPKK